MDSHQTFPGTERTPAAVVAELQYGPTMVSVPYRKRNGLWERPSSDGARVNGCPQTPPGRGPGDGGQMKLGPEPAS
jgi:hypothetical protein